MEHEKVKLPKFMCEWLDKHSLNYYPIRIVGVVYVNHLSDPIDVQDWLNDSVANQWKLIDALRYGYESEPEQLYYVLLIKNYAGGYLNQSMSDKSYIDVSSNVDSKLIRTKFTMPEIIAIDPRYKTFAVPVEEVDGNE